jgi:uncharacterized protein YeaO (DUF488 family)
MLKQACVADLKAGRVSRKDGHIVLAMRRYPRGVSKTLRDEYLSCLGPDAALLDDLHAKKQSMPHNEAFAAARYEERFDLSEQGRAELKRLAELSGGKDVYLICQCKPDERCHRELLMLIAQREFGARTAALRFEYPRFEKRT